MVDLLICIPVLSLFAPIAVALVAKRRQHLDPTPDRRRRRVARLLLGIVAYPAVTAVVWQLLRGSELSTWTILLLACPGLLVGALVNRLWITGVPPLAAGTLLLIRYLGDPSCAHSCGGDDTWPLIAITTTLYLVVPAVLALQLGMLARNLLATHHAARASRRSMTWI